MNMLELSRQRFSARKFTDQKVSPSDLDYLLECARLAPSAVTRPPWRFVGGDSVAIAAEHICLAATERGLGSCWVCNYDPDLMRSLFPLPDHEAVVILPVGHIAPDCPQKAKDRLPLAELTDRL